MDETFNGETPFWEKNSQETPISDDQKSRDINANKNTSKSSSSIKLKLKNINCCRYSRDCFFKWFFITIYLLFIIFGIAVLIIASLNKSNKYAQKMDNNDFFIVSVIIYEICDIISLTIILFTNYLEPNTIGYRSLKIITVFEMIYYIFLAIITFFSFYYYESPYKEIIKVFLFLNIYLRFLLFIVESAYLKFFKICVKT